MFSSDKMKCFENLNEIKMCINNKYANFLPEKFKNNPIGYIEKFGKNIKSGEKIIDDFGKVREDPTATKFLPEWKNRHGEAIQAVSKKVNLEKVRTKTTESGAKEEDPLLEHKMMLISELLGLPSAKSMGYIEQDQNIYTLMEKINGYAWTRQDKEKLLEKGLKEEDELLIKKQIDELIQGLKIKFEEYGIYRDWKHKDMVFDLDINKKEVISIIPVDWERSYLDIKKMEQEISPEVFEKIKNILNI